MAERYLGWRAGRTANIPRLAEFHSKINELGWALDMIGQAVWDTGISGPGVGHIEDL